MASQTHALHRSLLRPMVIHTLRAAGFQSTRPSVLDTFTSLAERYLLLLASTTATHALNAHSDAQPSLSDVRMALRDCGAIVGGEGASEEEWAEMMRVPVDELARQAASGGGGGESRRAGEKRKRDTKDVGDVEPFLAWFGGAEYAEIKRIAGMSDGSGTAAVGVGGGKVVADDFLQGLKRKQARVGGAPGGLDEARWAGTALGVQGEDREVVVEGGPVQRIRDWRPMREQTLAVKDAGAAKDGMDEVAQPAEVAPT